MKRMLTGIGSMNRGLEHMFPWVGFLKYDRD